jgi:glyoxylase-like metal-dependent hydrolase (beta-lactamase superfamily II)
MRQHRLRLCAPHFVDWFVTLTQRTIEKYKMFIPEDKVLVASDVLTPVPLIVRGDVPELIRSLKEIKALNLENVIQGHGGVLLRGEIDETVDASIAYLRCVEKKVQAIVDKELPRSELAKIDIEDCGRSRIPLGGLVQRLHLANLEYVYAQMTNGHR